MDNITKEEYLEAVSKGAEKAFSWEIEGLFSPESSFRTVLLKKFCVAIKKEQLMKGEPPCKATPGENND